MPKTPDRSLCSPRGQAIPPGFCFPAPTRARIVAACHPRHPPRCLSEVLQLPDAATNADWHDAVTALIETDAHGAQLQDYAGASGAGGPAGGGTGETAPKIAR